MRMPARPGPSSVALVLLLSCVPNSSGLGGSFSTGSSSESMTTSSSGPGSTGATSAGTTVAGATGSSTTAADSSTGPEEGSSSETGEPPPPWPSEPFGDPVPVDILNEDDSNDDDPTLTADQLELVFQSNRNGGINIYFTTRASTDSDWDVPEELTAANSSSEENTPEISADGLVLMFGSARRGGDDLDVYISYRRARDQPWSDPVMVGELSTMAQDFAPTLTFGQERIYVCSTRPGSLAGQNIWSADVSGNRGDLMFGPLTPVGALNTDSDDCTVFLSPDRRDIVFDSSQSGILGLWAASRDEPGQEFGAPQELTELNDPGAVDGDPWLSPDGHTIYFSSTRLNGTQDIFAAER